MSFIRLKRLYIYGFFAYNKLVSTPVLCTGHIIFTIEYKFEIINKIRIILYVHFMKKKRMCLSHSTLSEVFLFRHVILYIFIL